MSKLLKKTNLPFDYEQTGSVISFLIPNCLPVSVEEEEIISYVEEYGINTTDINGEELYNAPTASEYYGQNIERVLSKYFNRFILSNLKFLNDESQAYIESLLKRRAA